MQKSEAVTRLELRITPETIRAFARWSGDHSPLHVDENFARKSGYGGVVAHGMLSVTLLAAAVAHSRGAGIGMISGKFMRPMLLGETLILECSVPTESGEAEYSIRQTSAVTAAVVGRIRLVAVPQKYELWPGPSQNIIIEPQEKAADRRLDSIDRGEAGESVFTPRRMDQAAWEDFCRLVGFLRLEQAVSCELLALGQLSKWIGMKLPGRHATFLDFKINFEKPLTPGIQYRMRGAVDAVSASVGVVTQSLSVQEQGREDIMIRAKAMARVNEPPAVMPTFEALRIGADLGIRGKCAVVTGAARGIGETTAKLLAVHGARVVINYLKDEEGARRVADEIRKGGGEAICVQADVRIREDVRRLFLEAQAAFGAVQILVNSAVRDARPISFLELTWDEIRQDLETTLLGAVHTCQEAIPGMAAANWGKIINLSTVFTEDPPPQQGKYVISKSALEGLTRSLAAEFAGSNIQVNLVVPSIVETDLAKGVPLMLREKMRHDSPMGRMAAPEDVARAVVFLASNLSSFTTGQRIMVTGGIAPFL